MIRGRCSRWEVITASHCAGRRCLFLITSDQSQQNPTFSSACFCEQVKERKTIMSQHREGERVTETEWLVLSGPCWSLRLTNQKAAVRSSACGSLPLNGMTEVELKNGYGNTESKGSEWETKHWEKERGRFGGWALLVLCPFSVFKFNMKNLMSLKITKRAIVLFVQSSKFFVVCVYMW